MRFSLFIIFCLIFTTLSFSQSKQYTIGFLLDKNSTEINSLLDELSNEINAVVGEDAIITFSETSKLVNNFDSVKALSNYNLLLNNNTDIIIAFGTLNNIVINRQISYPKPVISFGAFSKELVPILKSGDDSKNLTTIVSNHSIKEDLEIIKELIQPEKLAIFVEKGFRDNQPVDAIVASLNENVNLKLDILSFETLSDILIALEGYDAIYMAGGFYLSNEEIKELANVLIEKQIPSFTATSVEDVELGLMATNQGQSDINQFFRRIALTVESIINEGESQESVINMDIEGGLTLNFSTAERVDIPIKYSLIASTTFVGNPNQKSAEKIYNLEEVMKEAISKNLQLETFRQDVLLNEKDVKFAKSDYLPDVSVSASGSYIDPKLAEVSSGQSPEVSTSGNVVLNQTLFSEAANANISIQKSLQKAQKENFNSEALNTVFDAASAYFNALILRTNLRIQNKNLELTKLNLKIASQNFEAGQAGKSDVLRFKSEKAQNTQELIQAINKYEQALVELNRILNNPINRDIDVDDSELQEKYAQNSNYMQLASYLDDPTLRETFVKFLVNEALINSPELKALNYNLDATERTERLYGSGRFLPTVALQGQYNYEFSRSGAGSEFSTFLPTPPEGYYNLGLRVSIPVFNQNKQNINKQIARIQKDQIDVNINDIKQSLETNIYASVLDLINQLSNIELSKIFEDSAKEALDLTQTSYASGAVNIVQLLDAQNNYLQAQQSSANAVYNFLFSSTQLERFTGSFFLLQTNQERQDFITRFLEYNQIIND